VSLSDHARADRDAWGAMAAPEGAASRHSDVTREWARRGPSEEIWVARLREGRASAVA
jgi:hypothetical protein